MTRRRTPDTVRHITTQLLAARLATGLHQRQVAEQVGVTQPAVSRIERGEAVPGLDTACALAAAVGLELVLIAAVPAEPAEPGPTAIESTTT